MAFHTFISETVDVAVFECGIGGAYDSTNVIESPALTAITSLGIDHVGMLGDTIDKIAWHKAGIMKRGVLCVTPHSQPLEAQLVLEEVADKKGCPLRIVKPYREIVTGEYALGLKGKFQEINASLALELAFEWLDDRGYNIVTSGIEGRVRSGLLNVRWPGRCQVRHDYGIRWCIDGAHTLESIKLAGEWFFEELITNFTQEPLEAFSQPRFLIFNQQTRDAPALARELFDTLSKALQYDPHPFTHVIFCTNTTFTETGYKPDLVSVNNNASEVEALTVQQRLRETWLEIDPAANVEVVRTIEEAVSLVKNFAEVRRNSSALETQTKTTSDADENMTSTEGEALGSTVIESATGDSENKITAFVTGSLHLIGGFLEVLDSTSNPHAADPSSTLANPPAPLASV